MPYLGEIKEEKKEPSKISRFAQAMRGLGAGLAAAGGRMQPLQQMQSEQERQRQMSQQMQMAQQKAAGERKKERASTRKQRLSLESNLRSELKPTVKRYKDIETAYDKVRTAGERKTAAGDLSMIFNYMKLLDPGSVVRESEFRSAEGAKAWLSRADDQGVAVPSVVRTAIQKADPAQKGAFLLPEQRRDFEETAKGVYGTELAAYDQATEGIKGIAQREGLNLKNIAYYRPREFKQIEKLPTQQPQQQPMSLAGQGLTKIMTGAGRMGIPSAQAATMQPMAKPDFSTMSDEELKKYLGM